MSVSIINKGDVTSKTHFDVFENHRDRCDIGPRVMQVASHDYARKVAFIIENPCSGIAR